MLEIYNRYFNGFWLTPVKFLSTMQKNICPSRAVV